MIAAYDSFKWADNPEWNDNVSKEKFEEMEIPENSAVALTDVIYYPNVLETAKKWADKNNRVFIILDIYPEVETKHPYAYYDSEGYFRVTNKDK